MKKVIIIILVVLLAVAAATGGFLWYRDAHIFVEDAVYAKNSEILDLRGQDISLEHYNSVHSQLPHTEIFWDVPFQGTKYANDITEMAISDLTEEDMVLLEYFPNLTKIDATGCENYVLLESLAALRPECQVIYQVNLGNTAVSPDHTALSLSAGSFDFDTLLENLKHLPLLTELSFPKTDLTLEQIDAVSAAYEGITVSYTVDIAGQELPPEVTEIDLSQLTSDQIEAVSQKIPMLPNLTSVELMTAEGTSSLSLADVKALNAAAPDAVFHYTFDFYGYTISTTDAEVHIKNKRIGDEGVEEVRQVLDIMENCDRFVLEYCSISNEVMAQLREDYRDTTKVVWRVVFGKGSCLTDSEVIRTTYNLTAKNCQDLIYCEDARYMDLGHNEDLTTVEFVAGMPNLEMIIVSGAPIKDLTPFENCKNLRILEIAFCHYIEDISPLAACENLTMLNIGYTQVTDLSVLDDKAMELLCLDGSKVGAEERARFSELQPDCWLTYGDKQPYGRGWRYDKEDKPLEWYSNIIDVFGYPEPMNNGGWYLDE
ncbi:MAG: hypothetical protein IJ001_05950 [Oscillospiraceae bacterium]|nr:hypothetical protein [Oscillospiraceae bacterium]